MKAISRFCYNHPHFGLPELMKYIALGNALVFVLDMLFNGMATLWLGFFPELILKGQVWRLVTFVFVSPYAGAYADFVSTFFFALSTYFYYWIGTALERHWGTARFNVFYLLGVVLNIILGLVAYLIHPVTAAQLGAYSLTVSMYYVNMSLFFSFATLYPDMRVLLYGIIPLKVKWIAWLDVALFAYDVLRSLAVRDWLGAITPVVALLNYLLFFYEDLANFVGDSAARAKHRHSRQTINFQQAQRDIKRDRGYLHKCAVCGVTDRDDPTMEFRYCSKCNGYYCYCMNHINNHSHVE